ncbi:ABC transporter permease subunit [Desulfosporosinus sp. OT]|uniref:PhnE/PtxC family ABC transporter permease n=1 Tax=Desulfosporosinus sp. OT TaxID=913865 RepID=UPI0002239E35|nr:ABC transporter permease subunit [Desulfosporosinus sp. OT]EGW40086.1 binding--dependent transport system inner membrane component family protein [Desulfosporosinus sp. OT]
MLFEESIKGWAQLGDSVKDNISVKSINPPLNKASFAMRAILLTLLALTIYFFFSLDYQGINVLQGFADTFDNFKTIFLHPHAHRFTLGEAFVNVVVTLGLAFLATLIGGIIALFLGLLAAQNLAPKHVTNFIKGFVAFIRAVPTILWVLIFAVAAGLGSAAAIIGLSFHSISYLTKAFSESFEDLDRSVIEALMASGANWWQIIFQAVIPSSVSYLLSWTFLRFEINFANAVAMGAAAGAGGIGFDLFMAGNFYFDLREVGVITYLIIAIAIVLEVASMNIKQKLQKST